MTDVELLSLDKTKDQITPEKKAEKENEETEELSLSAKIKEELSWAVMYCGAIGPAAIKRASCWPIRILWIVSMLASIGGTIYFLNSVISSYVSYAVLTQEIITQDYPSNFPAVTICNLNPFQPDASQTYIDNLLTLKNKTEFINITNTDTLEQSQDSNNTIDILNNLLDDLRLWVATDTSINQTAKKALGFSLDFDMLISCSFNGKLCSAQNFSYYRSYKYGNCYTFNSGYDANNTKVNLQQTSKAGSKYGLKMELMVGNPNSDIRFIYKSGIYVMIHNQSVTPLQFSEAGINLATGFDNFVGITRQFVSKLPSPYSTCIDDLTAPSNSYMTKLFGYITGLNINVYTQDFCYNICYQDQLIDKCSCADASLPTFKNAAYCTTQAQINCLKSFENYFDSSNLDVTCQNACPVKCNIVEYSTKVSNAMYPNHYYTNLLKSKSDFLDNLDLNTGSGVAYLRQSLVKVTINYEDLRYTQYIDVAQLPDSSFVAYIGGFIGVFIGVTFLNVLEIPHLIIALSYIVYQHKKAEKAKKNTVTPSF